MALRARWERADFQLRRDRGDEQHEERLARLERHGSFQFSIAPTPRRAERDALASGALASELSFSRRRGTKSVPQRSEDIDPVRDRID